MALSVETASAVINVVKQDPLCRKRISSSFYDKAPPGLAGQWRNVDNMILDKLLPNERFPSPRQIPWNTDKKTGRIKGLSQNVGSNEISSETQSIMCVGICDAAVDALKRAHAAHLPSLALIREISDGMVDGDEGHYQPKIKMRDDGSEYVFDWWMTLQIDNPIIWEFKIWRHWPAPWVHSLGIQFKNFKGF